MCQKLPIFPTALCDVLTGLDFNRRFYYSFENMEIEVQVSLIYAAKILIVSPRSFECGQPQNSQACPASPAGQQALLRCKIHAKVQKQF